jgi:phospholipid/cholesterol/gamma-HCH transport system substrate-binding protein
MSSTARLGAFIVVALLILALATFMLGNRQFLFSRTYRLTAQFDNVAGLDEGAPVRAGGVRIGTVRRIVLPGQPGDKVTTELQLEDSTRNVIRKDSTASVETEGLLGKKYVALRFGSGQAEPIRDGDTIEGRAPFEYTELARNAGDLVTTAKEAIESTKETIESTRVGISNINAASGNLKSITGKVDSGEGTIGALVSDPTAYRRLVAMLNQAQAGFGSLKEDMEALKHNPFVKGFFEKRGYFDSAELTGHALARLPARAPARKFTFDGKDLFEEPDSAKLRQQVPLDGVGAFLEGAPFGLAVIEVRGGAKGAKQDVLKLAQGRAVSVRQYLVQKYRIDDARVKTLALPASDQAMADSTGVITVVVYPGGKVRRGVEVRNK